MDNWPPTDAQQYRLGFRTVLLCLSVQFEGLGLVIIFETNDTGLKKTGIYSDVL